MTNLLALLGIGVLVMLWLDSARAREFALTLAQRYCEHRGMQLLDQSVSLTRIGLRWTNTGLCIRRMFRFEFSLEGMGRRTGYVLMLGARLETIDDGLPKTVDDDDGENDETTPPQSSDDNKVVPFKRRDQ